MTELYSSINNVTSWTEIVHISVWGGGGVGGGGGGWEWPLPPSSVAGKTFSRGFLQFTKGFISIKLAFGRIFVDRIYIKICLWMHHSKFCIFVGTRGGGGGIHPPKWESCSSTPQTHAFVVLFFIRAQPVHKRFVPPTKIIRGNLKSPAHLPPFEIMCTLLEHLSQCHLKKNIIQALSGLWFKLSLSKPIIFK